MCFVFFKQKTAYEMRISDWSSDVCSSDLIRYFDNAPFYGAGLAEIRMGEALKGKPRGEYVISTKVGRIVLDDIEQAPRDNGEKEIGRASCRERVCQYV